jgi:general secretion pathway protein A
MFLEHFQLRGNPFEVTADARFLYFGPDHRDALSAIYLSIIEGRGLAALIAGAGMGKTTLLRYLAARLRGRASVAFLSHPYSTRSDLMGDLAKRLGLPGEPSEYQLMGQLQLYLRQLAHKKRKLVLLFDEGQSLSIEALEQVRLLSNLRSSNMNLLEIVVAGQTELEDVLKQPAMEAFRQRVSVTARIGRLSVQEVGRYLDRRLKVVGRNEPLFENSAVEAVARESGGTPRNINQLCYKALALAWADGEPMVSENLVMEAARDIRGNEDAVQPSASGQDAASVPSSRPASESAAPRATASDEPRPESKTASSQSSDGASVRRLRVV